MNGEELKRIARVTLQHYDQRAEEFWQGTQGHDVRENIQELLRHLEGQPPFRILKAFAALGHVAVGLDGSKCFAAMARQYSGCEVLEQDFLQLELPPESFDGVFANAVLFHAPSEVLPRVLRDLRSALKPRGVLFSSNPRGNNEAGWSRGRYGVFHDWNTWRHFMLEAGFEELHHYYRPAGLPREQQPWLASSWRR
jgi:SAM-dependent methyltransferase